MDPGWQSEFRTRMRAFELTRAPREGEVSVSLKVRVVSGCFHREHSPQAYRLIDKQLASPASRRSEFAFVEHESGPELLVYVALATAGVALAKSVIDLIVAIIKARSEGVKKGDRPSDPVEVIVRRLGDGDKFVEETVVRVGHAEPVNRADIGARIDAAVKRLLEDKRAKTGNRSVQRTRRKRRGAERSRQASDR
jgi:hypothetical protein